MASTSEPEAAGKAMGNERARGRMGWSPSDNLSLTHTPERLSIVSAHELLLWS